MTFRSLYRLERHGLLDCRSSAWRPTTGRSTAVIERARESIVGTGEPLDEDVLRASRRASPTSRGLRRRRHLRAGRRRARGRAAAGLLPRDPAVPVRPGREGAGGGGADEVGPRRRREAVRPRPRLRPGARRRAARLHRRGAALQDRPLPGEDGLATRSSGCGSRTRCSSRSGAASTSRRSRSRWRSPSASRTAVTSTIRSGRCATSSSTTCMQVVSLCAMEAPARGDPQAVKDAQLALFRAVAEADPAHYVRGQYEGYRSIDGVAPDSTTETFAALRLDIQNWRWSGVPFFIRAGKRLPVTADGAPARLQAPAATRVRGIRRGRAEPARRQLDPFDRDPARARGPPRGRPRHDRAGHRVRRRGRRGPTPYEVLLHAALVGDSLRFTRQDGIEETWRVMQPLLDAPRPCTPTRRDVGPRGGRPACSPASGAGTSRGSRHRRSRA